MTLDTGVTIPLDQDIKTSVLKMLLAMQWETVLQRIWLLEQWKWQ